MRLTFTKMHGLGNDFVVLDAPRAPLELSREQLRRIADRHLGVGCDQILQVEPPRQPDTDFYYRIFNADGSEVGQCGNGALSILWEGEGKPVLMTGPAVTVFEGQIELE